jgi:hypothetical protein
MPLAANYDVFVGWVPLPLVSFGYRWLDADDPFLSKAYGPQKQSSHSSSSRMFYWPGGGFLLSSDTVVVGLWN